MLKLSCKIFEISVDNSKFIEDSLLSFRNTQSEYLITLHTRVHNILYVPLIKMRKLCNEPILLI